MEMIFFFFYPYFMFCCTGKIQKGEICLINHCICQICLMDCCREDTKTGLFGEFSQWKAFSLRTSLRINQGQNEKRKKKHKIKSHKREGDMPGTNRQSDKWMKHCRLSSFLLFVPLFATQSRERTLNNLCFLFSYLRPSDFLPFAFVWVIK